MSERYEIEIWWTDQDNDNRQHSKRLDLSFGIIADARQYVESGYQGFEYKIVRVPHEIVVHHDYAL